jgi:hypothetical protein
LNAGKLVGIVLIVAGVLALVYGSFSYTKETHEAKLGPVELSVKDKQTVNIPVWAGVGAIVIGGALLLLGGANRDPALGIPHQPRCAFSYAARPSGYFGRTRVMRQAECGRRTARSRVLSGTWYGRYGEVLCTPADPLSIRQLPPSIKRRT